MKAHLRNILISVLLFVLFSGQAIPPASGAEVKSDSSSAVPFAGPLLPASEQEAAGQIPVTAQVLLPHEAAPAQEADAWGTGAEFPVFRTLGGIGVVIFLMAAMYFAARKFAPRYFNKPVAERNLKVIETLPMGDKRSVSLIEVAGSRYLLGNTPQQISLLVSLPALPVQAFGAEAAPKHEPVKIAARKEIRAPFRNILEVEKRRPFQQAANPLPEDLRSKMKQLREALERS